ncbi:YeeE/YedE family protein [Sphingomonadaceae bacterium]|nr:YeeE/YedE family protein [Sphingomonadaceae bacterium]
MTSFSEIGLAALVITMAFIVGFVIRRGSICMVEATRLLVLEGRPRRLHAFALSGGVSALVIIPLSWLTGGAVTLESDYGVSGNLILAGCGLGLGALINGGCAFGTLAKLSGGRIEYAATIAASALAALWVLSTRVLEPVGTGWFAAPGWPGAAMLLASAVLVWPTLTLRNWRNIKEAVQREKTLLLPTAAMIVVGLLSGLLYSLAGSWTHLSLLTKEAQALTDQTIDTSEIKTLLGVLALVSGAVFAAVRSGSFKLVMPTLPGLVKRVMGGALMGAGAAIIPGGNGGMLTFGVPSGSASAWAGFATMTATLIVMFLAMKFLMARKEAIRSQTGV